MSDKPQALVVFGGWDGHTPKECSEVMAKALDGRGFDVTVKDSMDVYTDEAFMNQLSLIVPIWTMGDISKEQWAGLNHAVQSGVGLAGFHGGMIDSFRKNTEYQWMTGAQWVSHPGNQSMTYTVYVERDDHPITTGISDFVLPETEQYYCHHDPGNLVLCTTVFDQGAGDPTLYHQNAVLPYAWTKTWGKGRVFGACWGHTHKDFEVPECLELQTRGMQWASR